MFFMGLGSSILFTISLGVLSAAKDPDRGFGLKHTAEMLLGAIFIFIVANLIAGQFGYSGFAYGLLTLYIITGIGVFWLPINFLKMEVKENDSNPEFNGINYAALFATIAIFFFAGAYTGVWGFISFIGADHGISEAAINRVLTLALLAGICGALLCAWMGQRFGQYTPLLGGMLVMIIAVVLLIYS